MEAVDRHFTAAIEARRSIGDRSGEAGAIEMYVSALVTQYEFDRARPLVTDATERFADLTDDPAVIRLNAQLARLLFLTGSQAESIAIVDGVLEAAERLELLDVVANALITRGSALDELGRSYEGAGAMIAGRRLAAEHSFLDIEARAIINMAVGMLDRDPRAALELAREGIALENRIGSRSFQMTDGAFTAAFRLGEWDLALEIVEPLIDVETDPSIRGVFLTDVIDIRSFRGEPVADLLAAAGSLPDRDSRMSEAVVDWNLAHQAYLAGDFAEARRAWLHFGDLWGGQNLADALLEVARYDILARDPALARRDLADPPSRESAAA